MGDKIGWGVYGGTVVTAACILCMHPQELAPHRVQVELADGDSHSEGAFRRGDSNAAL